MQQTIEGALRRLPKVRIVIPFMLGIYIAMNIPAGCLFSNWSAFLLTLLGVLLLIVLHFFSKTTSRIQTVAGICYYLIILIWGYSIACLQLNQYSPLRNNEKYHFVAKICEVPVVKAKTIKTILLISQIENNGVSKRQQSRVVAYFAKDTASTKLRLGDVVVAKAYVNPIEDFKTKGQFSYRNYMAGKQIYNRMYIPAYWWKMLQPAGWSLMAYSMLVRDKIDSIYKRCGFPAEEQTVLSALMLGVRTDMSPELLTAYSSTGAMHILAVSGLHVGILYLVMTWILFFMRGRYLKMIKGIIILLSIWFYAFMTGFSPSIERAAVMFSLLAVARQFRLSSNVYNTLAGTAFISLLINPLDMFDVGFQLSYLAIVGIVYFQKLFDSWFSPENYFGKKLWELLSVSVAAQILTLPLTMYYFGQIPLYFLLTNLIAIPVSFVVMVLGIAVIPLTYISKQVFQFIAFFLGKSVWLQNASIKWIAALPSSSIHCSVPLWVTIFLFCVIAGLMFIIERKRFQ